jgi:hypothetical protein
MQEKPVIHAIRLLPAMLPRRTIIMLLSVQEGSGCKNLLMEEMYG